MTRHRLIHIANLTPIPTKIICQPPLVFGIYAPPVNVSDRIIDDFSELLIHHFKPSDTNKHGVEHYIITLGPPLHAHIRHLDADKLSAAKTEFAKIAMRHKLLFQFTVGLLFTHDLARLMPPQQCNCGWLPPSSPHPRYQHKLGMHDIFSKIILSAATI